MFRAVTAMRTYQSFGRRMSTEPLPENVLHQPARFVTALAHEVRNPLTNINLAVDMLECAARDDDPKLYLDIIKRSSARINHLISDLLKFQAMSSENGELRLTEGLVDDHYSLQIGDNGCGIPAEHLQEIFKPYFTRKPGGLGLGLSTTWDILLANHIRMDVESKEGEGTCFTLLFGHENVRTA